LRSIFSKISSLKFRVVDSVNLLDKQINVLISRIRSTCRCSSTEAREDVQAYKSANLILLKGFYCSCKKMAAIRNANERVANGNGS
jgi:hypothetical protein